MKLKHIAATALITLGLVASPASFASIIGTSNVNNLLNFSGTMSADFWRAQSFTVASGQDYVLSDVQIITHNFSPNTFLRIYADNASTVGAQLEQLSFSSVSPTTVNTGSNTFAAQLLTFSSSGLSLTANSTYWVVGGLTAGSGTSWYGTLSTSETGLLGWTMGNGIRSTLNAGSSWGNPISVALFTTINVNPQNVPEPSTLALIGIAGISLLRRRKTA